MTAFTQGHHFTMKRFALKLLLTSQALHRRSGRLDPFELVTWLLTTLVIAFIGIYVWVRGPY